MLPRRWLNWLRYSPLPSTEDLVARVAASSACSSQRDLVANHSTGACENLILPPARRVELAQSLMMFFAGFSRFATDFAQDQIKNMNSRKNQLRMIRSLVDSAADILHDPKTPLRELGELMHQSWQIKRELAASVSNSQIDDIYEAGRDAGAVGGKLLGAGGGGFMVLLVDPEKRGQVRERLRKLIHVNVGFDADGSTIVERLARRPWPIAGLGQPSGRSPRSIGPKSAVFALAGKMIRS